MEKNIHILLLTCELPDSISFSATNAEYTDNMIISKIPSKILKNYYIIFIHIKDNTFQGKAL